jgi:UDP-N-acetylglucosamine 2-epimerase (non-hydrolysing)
VPTQVSPRKRVLVVVGTRPEAIKLAPVILELRSQSTTFEVVTCVTGQHRDLLAPMLDLFAIIPDFDLAVMEPNQSLSELTGKLFTGLHNIVQAAQPEWVVTQGDTTTAMVASMVAFYHRTSTAHVEAGLRTGDRWSPFPEEINRRIADMLADLHFAPTERAKTTLMAEGVPENAIVVSGNTVVDALQAIVRRPYDWTKGPLGGVPRDKRLIVVTAHRRESFGPCLHEICMAIRELAQRLDSCGVHLVYPVHPNPNVQSAVCSVLSGLPNVSLLAPLDYQTMAHLLRNATLVLTDSGGIQEEAPSFGVPVLILRDKTERPEGVEAGIARLVGTSREHIVTQCEGLILNPAKYAAMQQHGNPYGDGKAAARIVAALLRHGRPTASLGDAHD